jgi:hypothetical protein
MAQYAPPLYGVPYVFSVSLVSQANTKVFQSDPTLASGDAKISKDNGALANLSTLPAVTPASSKLVKVTVSATEMQADNVSILLSDAAGDEWCDLEITIQPSRLMEAGTVDNTAHTPTTTEFEADDITEANADQFIGRRVLFTSGTNEGQMATITDYALTGGRGHFTVVALTDAPSNNDTFVVL